MSEATYYVLGKDGRTLSRVADRETLCSWLHEETRRTGSPAVIVAADDLTPMLGRNVRVVTHFHGVDHGGKGPFETVLFIGFGPAKVRGSRTWEDAERAHSEMVSAEARGRSAA